MSDHHPRPGEPGEPRPSTPPPSPYWSQQPEQPHQPPRDPGHGWPPPPERSRGRVPAWLWPVVAVLALLVGLVGGAIGAVVVDRVQDEALGQPVSGGLPEVETREEAPLPAANRSVARVADELLPSTVQILAEYDGQASGATGSGFVLDRQGHVVTNNHVVKAAAEDEGPIEVVDHRGRTYDATVVGRSSVYDLAVLELRGEARLQPAALGSAQAMRVGDQVVAFGAPLGLSQTVTSGIISAKDRPVTTGESGDDSSYINAVQTDAAINPGNSGGPLVNLGGEVVGVNSAIATTGGTLGGEGGNIGVGFAIPIEQVRITADQILRTGEARYPVIGAQVRIGGGTTLDGARITEVMDGTAAAEAGLRAGDVVREVGDEQVADGIALIVAIRTHQPGEKVGFVVVRDGEERTVEVTLDGKVG